MCCFSGRVNVVAGTSIFARRLANGRQAIVYEMSLSADDDVAMVLPIPVLAGAGESAVEFVSFQSYPQFFRDCEKAFPLEGVKSFGPQPLRSQPLTRSMLVVHDVGDFEASFVPTAQDFARLDPRFRMPERVFERLPEYADWGFAVFKLKVTRDERGFFARMFGKPRALSASKRYHPMAFTFPTRDQQRIFFPTLHVHDGEVHEYAEFDHSLYLQTPDERLFAAFQRSERPARAYVEPRHGGLVDDDACLHRARILGYTRNKDIWL
jgi:hypothetical protein